jgi:hypothetical protein
MRGEMRKDIQKAIEELKIHHSIYEGYVGALASLAMEVCDFDADITYCAGDGHLVINLETTTVSTLNCLEGRTKRNKLSAEEHLYFAI